MKEVGKEIWREREEEEREAGMGRPALLLHSDTYPDKHQRQTPIWNMLKNEERILYLKVKCKQAAKTE